MVAQGKYFNFIDRILCTDMIYCGFNGFRCVRHDSTHAHKQQLVEWC
jgi:hypothetical protein